MGSARSISPIRNAIFPSGLLLLGDQLKTGQRNLVREHELVIPRREWSRQFAVACFLKTPCPQEAKPIRYPEVPGSARTATGWGTMDFVEMRAGVFQGAQPKTGFIGTRFSTPNSVPVHS